MRGCVTAVLLFLFSTAAFPQCNYTNAGSAQFRASYLDAAVDGNDLWTATSYGVQLSDRSVDPPRIVATLALPGTTRAIAAGSGTVYAGSGSRIYAIRKNGSSLSIAGFVEAGAQVNDLVIVSTYLYAATNNGLQQFTLANSAFPGQTQTLATSSPTVLSLSAVGNILYAADGDKSVEQFTVSLGSGQQIGSYGTATRAIAVHGTTNRLFVSDGQDTDVFIVNGTTASRVATVPFGSIAFALLTPDVTFMAGSDRHFRTIDWTTVGSPVELFGSDISPNGGTINRVSDMQIAGGRVYLAAGDAGLLSYDVSTFASPFPVRSYTTSATTSTLWASGELYASRTTGGISDYTKSSSGNLTLRREWDTSRQQTLQDAAADILLSSTGSSLLYWNLGPTVPVLITAAPVPFASSIVSAIVTSSRAVVVLDDNSVWTADLSQTTPQPQKTQFTATAVAHAGSGLVLSDVDADRGTTTLTYFAADLTSQPKAVTLPGAATSRVAVSGTTAAIFTFQGINVIDLSAQSTTVIPQSNTPVSRALAFAGTRLLELTDSALLVWDMNTRRLVRTIAIPREGFDLAADQLAAIATSAGVMTVNVDATSSNPSVVPTVNPNSYYKKVAAAGDRLYLFDGHKVDIFATTTGYYPKLITTLTEPGIVDIAATPTALFAVRQLSTATAVLKYTRDGYQLASRDVDEDAAVPLNIFTAGGGVWLSISRGCLAGLCEKKTIVYDGQTLVRSATLDGGVVDIATSGRRAFAVFDVPAELRVYNIDDAAHPAQIASRATEGVRTPVSISVANGLAYVLGEKLVTYAADDTLNRTGDQLGTFQQLSGGSSYTDQRVYAESGCVAVSGRSSGMQWFAQPSWSATTSDAPANIRSIAAGNGRLFVLTDDSLEIFASGPATPPAKRKAAR